MGLGRVVEKTPSPRRSRSDIRTEQASTSCSEPAQGEPTPATICSAQFENDVSTKPSSFSSLNLDKIETFIPRNASSTSLSSNAPEFVPRTLPSTSWSTSDMELVQPDRIFDVSLPKEANREVQFFACTETLEATGGPDEGPEAETLPDEGPQAAIGPDRGPEAELGSEVATGPNGSKKEVSGYGGASEAGSGPSESPEDITGRNEVLEAVTEPSKGFDIGAGSSEGSEAIDLTDFIQHCGGIQPEGLFASTEPSYIPLENIDINSKQLCEVPRHMNMQTPYPPPYQLPMVPPGSYAPGLIPFPPAQRPYAYHPPYLLHVTPGRSPHGHWHAPVFPVNHGNGGVFAPGAFHGNSMIVGAPRMPFIPRPRAYSMPFVPNPGASMPFVPNPGASMPFVPRPGPPVMTFVPTYVGPSQPPKPPVVISEVREGDREHLDTTAPCCDAVITVFSPSYESEKERSGSSGIFFPDQNSLGDVGSTECITELQGTPSEVFSESPSSSTLSSHFTLTGDYERTRPQQLSDTLSSLHTPSFSVPPSPSHTSPGSSFVAPGSSRTSSGSSFVAPGSCFVAPGSNFEGRSTKPEGGSVLDEPAYDASDEFEVFPPAGERRISDSSDSSRRIVKCSKYTVAAVVDKLSPKKVVRSERILSSETDEDHDAYKPRRRGRGRANEADVKPGLAQGRGRGRSSARTNSVPTPGFMKSAVTFSKSVLRFSDPERDEPEREDSIIRIPSSIPGSKPLFSSDDELGWPSRVSATKNSSRDQPQSNIVEAKLRRPYSVPKHVESAIPGPGPSTEPPEPGRETTEERRDGLARSADESDALESCLLSIPSEPEFTKAASVSFDDLVELVCGEDQNEKKGSALPRDEDSWEGADAMEGPHEKYSEIEENRREGDPQIVSSRAEVFAKLKLELGVGCPDSKKKESVPVQNGKTLDHGKTDEYAFSDGGSLSGFEDFAGDSNSVVALSEKGDDEFKLPGFNGCMTRVRKIECRMPLSWDYQDTPTWTAVVSYAKSPREMYLNLLDFQDTFLLKEIEESLDNIFGTEVPRIHTFQEICEGSYWAGCDNGVWYRVKILRILKNTVEVFVVDYGFTTRIDIQNLRHLPEYLMDYHPAIVQCSIYGVKPCGGAADWSGDEKKLFSELFSVEDMQYSVIPVRLRAVPESSEPLLIIMSYAEHEVLIDEVICEMGIAESCFDEKFIKEKENVGENQKLKSFEEGNHQLTNGASSAENTEWTFTENGEASSATPVNDDDEDGDSGGIDWEDDFDPMAEDYCSSRNTKYLDDENLDALELGFSRDESKYCRFGLKCHHKYCDKEHVDLTDPLPNEKVFVPARMLNLIDLPKVGSYVELLIFQIVTPQQMVGIMPNGIRDLRGLDEPTKEDPETLFTLQAALQKHYWPTKHPDFKGLPAIAELMAAKSDENDTWYRVRVLESSEHTIEVYLVDYGRVEKVALSRMRTLVPKFLHLPEQAISITLSSIGPADKQRWGSEANDFLESCVSGRSLIARINAVTPAPAERLFVTLWLPGEKTTSENSLNQKLIDMNLACNESDLVPVEDRIPG